jgi:phosphoserine phosphatase
MATFPPRRKSLKKPVAVHAGCKPATQWDNTRKWLGFSGMTMIKLVAFDMEGCLTDDPTIWEIMHRKWGTWESHGLPYWDRYLAGEFGFDDFARMDVAAWRGAPVDMLKESIGEVPLMPGCGELLGDLRKRGIRIAIITNGLVCLAERFCGELGVEWVYGNAVEAHGSRLTGGLSLRVPFRAKGETLREIAGEMGLQRREIAAVGDGRADVEMFRLAGKSVAFCPRHLEVAEQATHVVRERDLRALLPILTNGGSC